MKLPKDHPWGKAYYSTGYGNPDAPDEESATNTYVDYEKCPYACAECGIDLTPADCIMVGSVNYCESHARQRQPGCHQLGLTPWMRSLLNTKRN